MNPPPQSLYLMRDDEAAFVTLHEAQPPQRGSAVLICPPFGWEEVCAYRSLRSWAFALAASGHPVLRLSYPSTGDSAGSVEDPDRLGAWTRSVADAAEALRESTGASRTVAITMGLGGMLAVLALAEGAQLDELVLWGAPGQGRGFLRQLRAIRALETSIIYEGETEPAVDPAAGTEAGGFRLSAETTAALEQVDLGALTLPPAADRRVLLFDRDGIAPDERLLKCLRRSDAALSFGDGGGYAAMTSHPQTAEPAAGVFDAIVGWIDRAPQPDRARPHPRPVSEALVADLVLNGARETPMTIPATTGSLSAVLSRPSKPKRGAPAVVLLNGGAVRRIGPSRMWVEASRRWAADGAAVLRLDVAGIGESAGEPTPYRADGDLYAPELVTQVLGVLDHLQALGVADRFVLGGLCAGAYWSFEASARDPRIVAALMLNPRAFVFDRHLAASRDLRQLFTGPISFARLRRNVTPARIGAVARWALSTALVRLRRLARPTDATPAASQRLAEAVDAFLRSATPGLILFSNREPLRIELESSGYLQRMAASGVQLGQVPVNDHTMRPVWAQHRVHDLLDEAIARAGATLASRADAPVRSRS